MLNHFSLRDRISNALSEHDEAHWKMLGSWVDSIVIAEDAESAHLQYDGMTRHVEWDDTDYFLIMAIEAYLTWVAFRPYKNELDRAQMMRQRAFSANLGQLVDREIAESMQRERRDELTLLALQTKAESTFNLYIKKNQPVEAA